MPIKREDDVTFVRAELIEQIPDMEIVDNVLSGDSVIKVVDNGRKYLPQEPNETDDDYEDRKNINYFFAATGRAKEDLLSKVFKQDLVTNIEEIGDETIRNAINNIDRQGNNLTAFAKENFGTALDRGMAIILCDYPDTTMIKSLREQKDADIYPYFVNIDRKNIINWRLNINEYGQSGLSMIVIERQIDTFSGEFGIKKETIWEEFRIGSKKVWKKEKGVLTFIETEMKDINGNRLKEIPLSVGFFDKIGDFMGRSVMLDHAKENLKHYRASTDRRAATNSHCYMVPILTGVSVKEKKGMGGKIKTGFRKGYVFEKDVKGFYLEPSGNGAKLVQEDVVNSERLMSFYRMSTLDPNYQTRAETFGGALLDKASEDSPLTAWTKVENAVLVDAFRHWFSWYGIKENEINVELNTDYTSSAASPELMNVLADWVSRGGIDWGTARKIAREMGLSIPDEAVVQQSIGQSGLDDLNSVELNDE